MVTDKDSSPAPKAGHLGPQARSLVSLFIFVHLFCVFVGLFGNESLSVLNNRLRRLLAPYSRLLNLDPQFAARFHLTQAMEYEDDHQLVVTAEGLDEPFVIPTPEVQSGMLDPLLGFRLQRWRNLSARVGMMASEEDDPGLAEFARAFGEDLFGSIEARRFVLQCRRFQPPGLLEDIEYDPADARFFQPLYSADVIKDSRDVVRVHKQVPTDEAAQVKASSP